MTDETEDAVLTATVGEWQLGAGPGAAVIRLSVVSPDGERTTLAETEATAGEYKLVRCGDPPD